MCGNERFDSILERTGGDDSLQCKLAKKRHKLTGQFGKKHLGVLFKNRCLEV